MTLFLPPGELLVLDQSRLHAFVIGVGDYPHLGDGGGPPALDDLGLGQVTTSRYSAPAIADWLLSEYQNAACPLGSVELLVSPATHYTPPGGAAVPVDAGTMANIAAACTLWHQRCNSRTDNIAFFYFCGHGLQKTSQVLLAEDFGDPAKPDIFVNCVDFDAMRAGMYACRANDQFFFVDACRDCPQAALAYAVTGQALINGNLTMQVAENSSVYRAAHARSPAFGPATGVSFFGQALLRCLRGVGAVRSGSGFAVTAISLGTAIPLLMQYMKTKASRPLTSQQEVSGKLSALATVQRRKVLAAIAAENRHLNPSLEVTLTRHAAVETSLAGDSRPFEIDLEVGDWTLQATFGQTGHPNYGPEVHTLTEPVEEVFIP